MRITLSPTLRGLRWDTESGNPMRLTAGQVISAVPIRTNQAVTPGAARPGHCTVGRGDRSLSNLRLTSHIMQAVAQQMWL